MERLRTATIQIQLNSYRQKNGFVWADDEQLLFSLLLLLLFAV